MKVEAPTVSHPLVVIWVTCCGSTNEVIDRHCGSLNLRQVPTIAKWLVSGDADDTAHHSVSFFFQTMKLLTEDSHLKTQISYWHLVHHL